MNVTFRCPRCEATARVEICDHAPRLTCPHCGLEIEAPEDAYEPAVGTVASGSAGEPGWTLRRCLVCPSADLFVRKDFPQRLGVAIVVLGFAASCVAWYYHYLYATFGVLFATALVDVLLFVSFGSALQCYRCGAIYRGASDLQSHEPFDLDTHERHRQLTAQFGPSAGRVGAAGATIARPRLVLCQR